MGVILQANYRRQANPTVSVPAPSDGDGDPYWCDHLAKHMHEYAAAGFTHYQLPPIHMTQSQHFPNADGYGVECEYNLGSEEAPTRFGTAERWQRTVAIGYANGMKPLVDWVPHQRSGNWTSKSATGKVMRFAKTPGCFMAVPWKVGEEWFGPGPFTNGVNEKGRVPRDPIAGPVGDDFPFGDELCPINSVPKDYVMDGLIDAGDWLFRRLNIAGCRNDDTKGQAFEAVRRWANAKAMAGKYVIGEYAEGNKDTLGWWIDQLNGRCYTYDFEVKYHLRDMCNNGSRWDMRRLQNTGLASKGWWYATKAVTFIENADSDTNGFGAAVFNKLLGYAFILTSEGWPSVYYRDYAQEKYCYGLKPHIDNLMWIREHLAKGSTQWLHSEYQFAVFYRDEWPGLLVGLNNDIWGGWKKVTVQTSFGPNTRLHDYTGHVDDTWTDWQGKATIWIPPNDNGKGYCCFSKAGQNFPNTVHSSSTTQEFEGADDLDIAPAIVNQINGVTRVWVKLHSKVTLHVTHPTMDGIMFPMAHLPSGTTMTAIKEEPWTFTCGEEGWVDLGIDCQGARSYPPGTAIPFVLKATYSAPQELQVPLPLPPVPGV